MGAKKKGNANKKAVKRVKGDGKPKPKTAKTGGHLRTGTLPNGRQSQTQAKKEAQKSPGVKKPYKYLPGGGEGGKWKKKIAIKNDKTEGEKPVKLN